MRPLLALLLALSLAACAEEPADTSAERPARPAALADSTLSEPDEETLRTFRQVLADARAQDVKARPYGEVVQWVGEQLLGRPYEVGLLDRDSTAVQESMLASLRAFDCVLYIENVLALADAIVAEDDSFAFYERAVEAYRYRGGEMGDYCSRLHYFSEWILDNEQRGALRDVTREIGGEVFDKTVNFMSQNRSRYPRLADDEQFACIQRMEARLAGHTIYYVPQDRIREVYDQLQHGDVIAAATDIGGIDFSHTGFVYKHADGRTGFLHASLSGEVKISPDLEDYVQGVKRQVGITVARPAPPSERPQS